MPWCLEKECFTSARVNHILRVTNRILNELRLFVPIRYPKLGHGVCVLTLEPREPREAVVTHPVKCARGLAGRDEPRGRRLMYVGACEQQHRASASVAGHEVGAR
jgi:hypothetical protein